MPFISDTDEHFYVRDDFSSVLVDRDARLVRRFPEFHVRIFLDWRSDPYVKEPSRYGEMNGSP